MQKRRLSRQLVA